MAITQEYEAAKKANEERYAQAMQIYDEIISRYRPGGEFQKAQLGELEKRKTRDVGTETQQLISSGMYGTTTTAGLPRKWESEVGAPSRLKLEDIMMQRLSTAQVGKAGFMERKEDVYPDVGAYAQYAGAAAAQPKTTTRTVGGTYGASSFPDMFSISGGGGGTTGGTGGTDPYTAYNEAARMEREKRAKAASTVSSSTRALAGATTPGQAQTAVQTDYPAATPEQLRRYKLAMESKAGYLAGKQGE